MEEMKVLLTPSLNTKLDAREKGFLDSVIKDFRLSASALNEYLECPLKFKFNRLLKVPLPANKALALGNAIHKVMEVVGRNRINDKKTSQKEIEKVFIQALSSQQLGAEDYKLVLTEGKKLLKQYFEFYDGEKSDPAAVEYYVRGVPLELPGMDPIILTGKIDLVEWVDRKEGLVKVVDFKTSSPKTENQIRGLTKNSDKNIWRQLVFYKLLTDLDPNFKPQNKMNKFRIAHAEVDFVKPKSSSNTMVRIPIEISDEDVEEVKKEIAEVMTRIRNQEFYDLNGFPDCEKWDLIGDMTQNSILFEPDTE